VILTLIILFAFSSDSAGQQRPAAGRRRRPEKGDYGFAARSTTAPDILATGGEASNFLGPVHPCLVVGVLPCFVVTVCRSVLSLALFLL